MEGVLMFWERFYELCCDMGKKPNPVAKELGLSSGVLTKWKNGITYPNGEILIAIAKYFNCSIDYLVGLTSQKRPYKRETSTVDSEILEKFHALPREDQEELMLILNYKYEQYQRKKMCLSSSSGSATDDEFHDMLA